MYVVTVFLLITDIAFSGHLYGSVCIGDMIRGRK